MFRLMFQRLKLARLARKHPHIAAMTADQLNRAIFATGWAGLSSPAEYEYVRMRQRWHS